MNQRQAEALQRMMQDRYPDAIVTVAAQDDGAEINIIGSVASPGVTGIGKENHVKLAICDEGPFMRSLISQLVLNSRALG